MGSIKIKGATSGSMVLTVPDTGSDNVPVAVDSLLAKTGDGSGLSGVGTGKNLIINGGFDVWQRATSSTAQSYAHTDRWRMNSNTNDTWTFSKYDIPVSGETGLPRHITNAIKIAQTAGTTGTLNDFRTRLENPEMFIGQTVTLSFYARATNSINLTGNTRIFIMPASGSAIGTGVTEMELTSTWQRFTRTITFANASTQTYNSSSHLDCIFSIEPNITSDMYITGVQLELGSVATDFEHRSYGEELALCQRYYLKFPNNMFIDTVHENYNAVQNQYAWHIRFDLPVEMRVTPTIETFELKASDGTNHTNAMTRTISNTRIIGWRNGAGATNGTADKYLKFLSLSAEL